MQLLKRSAVLATLLAIVALLLLTGVASAQEYTPPEPTPPPPSFEWGTDAPVEAQVVVDVKDCRDAVNPFDCKPMSFVRVDIFTPNTQAMAYTDFNGRAETYINIYQDPEFAVISFLDKSFDVDLTRGLNYFLFAGYDYTGPPVRAMLPDIRK